MEVIHLQYENFIEVHPNTDYSNNRDEQLQIG